MGSIVVGSEQDSPCRVGYRPSKNELPTYTPREYHHEGPIGPYKDVCPIKIKRGELSERRPKKKPNNVYNSPSVITRHTSV